MLTRPLQGYIDRDGKRHYPVTALVCNFSKPTAKKPSLLKHEEVVTLFHELGHGIHDLVSRTKYSRFHGTSTVRDFVEAPSQMLEHWCWTPAQLKSLSKHYSYLSAEYESAWREGVGSEDEAARPPEKMPDSLIDSLIKTRHVNDAMFMLRQLHFGIFDMTIHEPKTHEDIVKLKVTELYNTLRKEIVQLDGPEVWGAKPDWGHGQATFGHLMGGYDAGYYGYARLVPAHSDEATHKLGRPRRDTDDTLLLQLAGVLGGHVLFRLQQGPHELDRGQEIQARRAGTWRQPGRDADSDRLSRARAKPGGVLPRAGLEQMKLVCRIHRASLPDARGGKAYNLRS